MCHAVGPGPVYLESLVAKRVSHPRDPFHRRRVCHGPASGARGRCGRSHAVPTCAPGPRQQSDFSAVFCAAILVLCDPILCSMKRKRAAKKVWGRGEKVRLLCAPPRPPLQSVLIPKSPSAPRTPTTRYIGGAGAMALPRALRPRFEAG